MSLPPNGPSRHPFVPGARTIWQNVEEERDMLAYNHLLRRLITQNTMTVSATPISSQTRSSPVTLLLKDLNPCQRISASVLHNPISISASAGRPQC
jgi:hypothetical protein